MASVPMRSYSTTSLTEMPENMNKSRFVGMECFKWYERVKPKFHLYDDFEIIHWNHDEEPTRRAFCADAKDRKEIWQRIGTLYTVEEWGFAHKAGPEK
ncbi:hypothetical protein AVEN_268626-1 [Araneus ventricosus]|uniref:Uncharacterized protein n=1 Tax=Araneus ventricosus TaxID=182803 RepID=A0A4Y2L182_ARAVE|nr:hypothetical protein AVEN_268626-1 [Araneus ventricosus]